MNPEELLKTIYLGDRGINNVLIDCKQSAVIIEVNIISRIRSLSGNWEYYCDEDIENGRIVFTGVTGFQMNPPGLLPNDFIYSLTVTPMDDVMVAGKAYRFNLEVGSGDIHGNLAEVTITTIAKGIHLEDPRRPGSLIVD